MIRGDLGRELQGAFGERFETLWIAHDHVRSGPIGGVQPEVPGRGDAEGQGVVLLAAPSDEDRQAVGAGVAPDPRRLFLRANGPGRLRSTRSVHQAQAGHCVAQTIEILGSPGVGRRPGERPPFLETPPDGLESFFDRDHAPFAFLVALEQKAGVLRQRQGRIDRDGHRSARRIVRIGDDRRVSLDPRPGQAGQEGLAQTTVPVARARPAELVLQLPGQRRQPLDLPANQRLVVVPEILEVP